MNPPRIKTKIQPEMISLNPDFIGTVDRAPREVIAEENKLAWEVNYYFEFMFWGFLFLAFCCYAFY